MANPRLTLAQLADRLGAELRLKSGSGQLAGETDVAGVATLKSASPAEVAFLANARYRNDLLDTRALAVILAPEMVDDCPVHCIVHPQPYLCYAKLTRLLENRPRTHAGIDASAHVHHSARIGSAARIGPGTVIAEGVTIGDNAEIAANVVVEANVVIGDNVYLSSNVSIAHAVVLGDNVRVQSGTVIGSEGFGYAPRFDAEQQSVSWNRIAQLGSVKVGDNVEIGANTSIDRGALDDTVIEDNVIIDNQVQIAHNVRIGSGSAIAGCVGIAGSASIGKRCNIGGGAGIAGHLSIADDTTVLGMTLINRSVNQPGTYASGTGMQPAASWRKSAVRFTQLESLNRRVKSLEKLLEDKAR